MRVIFLILFTVSAFSQISVDTKLSDRTLRVGDQLTLTVTVTCPNENSVRFSELTPETDAMSVLKEEITPESITYTLAFWEIGEFTIPGISFDILKHGQLESTFVTDPELITIESMITDSNDQIRDIKGMHEVQLRSPYLKYVFLTGILFSLFLIWFILKKKNKAVVKAEKWQKPKEPPRIHALKRLETLNCPYPINTKSCEIFYLELTSILKEYLENELFFKAMEMTTEEIKDYLSKTMDDTVLLNETIALLSSSDLSKFAKHIPNSETFQNDKNRLKEIINAFYQRVEKGLKKNMK
ncbi:MAG: hypothetical protein ACE5D7_04310, partial [Fidelibacterota bacterium]